MVANSTDFEKALLDFKRLQQMAFYDRQGTAAVVTADAQSLATAFVGSSNRVDQIPAVFALTDALQEQNFHWREKFKSISSEDRKLALRALANGDAVLTGLAHIAGRQPIKWQDYVQTVGRLTTALDRLASDLPQLLRDKLIFPYRDGAQFVQWAYAAHGSRGVDALFVNPPISTSQILHPEKYYTQRENPLRIVPWGLVRQMKEPAVVDQTLGEYLIRQLVATNSSANEAAKLTSGWTGDQLSAYRDGENLITCWISTWRNETRAQSFALAFQRLFERRHRLRFTKGQNGSMNADLGAGRSTVIQFKGQVVVFLDGVPSARELQLRESIWEDLEISTEPPAMPFDYGRLGLQLASRSR